jgi:hypothetical protein
MPAIVCSNGTALRRAVLASVVLHVALAFVAVLALRSRPDPRPARPGVETAVEAVVHLSDAGAPLNARAPEPPADPPPATVPPPPDVGRTPHALPTPQRLPAAALAVISRSVARQSIAAPAPAAAGGVPALHGGLAPGRSVVYLLDASGSMGEHGKLALARSALVATLRAQPEGVRFQVIVYDGSARPLLPGDGCVPATPSNVDAAAARAAGVEPRGRSNHAEALRAAARRRPDAILILTDAGLTRGQLGPALAGLAKPTYICLSTVTPGGVEPPRELR